MNKEGGRQMGMQATSDPSSLTAPQMNPHPLSLFIRDIGSSDDKNRWEEIRERCRRRRRRKSSTGKAHPRHPSTKNSNFTPVSHFRVSPVPKDPPNFFFQAGKVDQVWSDLLSIGVVVVLGCYY